MKRLGTDSQSRIGIDYRLSCRIIVSQSPQQRNAQVRAFQSPPYHELRKVQMQAGGCSSDSSIEIAASAARRSMESEFRKVGW